MPAPLLYVLAVVVVLGAAVAALLGVEPRRPLPRRTVPQLLDEAMDVEVVDPRDDPVVAWRVPVTPAPVMHHRLNPLQSARLALVQMFSGLAAQPLSVLPPTVGRDDPEPGESTEDDVEPLEPEEPPAAPEVARVPEALVAALNLRPDWPTPVDSTVPAVPQDAALYESEFAGRYAELDAKGPAVPDWPTGSWAILNHSAGSPV